MDLPINTFKQALQNKQPQYGLWLGLADTGCTEICAGAGFDWLLIDAEHAPYSIRDIRTHLQVIAPYNIPALVRPAEGSTSLLKQLLDVGAQTVLIPMVESAEQARELVQAVRYPPQGIRGLGTSMARAARWNHITDYLHKANEQICLIVQAETTRALTNLEDIAAVEGVDAVFFGPSDLSASMGHTGNPGHPDVVAAIENGFKIAHAAGKATGVLAVNPTLASHYAQKGASFIGVGVDAALLTHASKQLAEHYKQGQSKHPAPGY